MPILLLSCEKEPLLLIFWNDIVIFFKNFISFQKKNKNVGDRPNETNVRSVDGNTEEW